MPRQTMPRYAARAPLPLPADVRLMNAVASTVYLVAGAGALVAAVLWLMRSPLFPIRAIVLAGELQRNSVATIRANAAPQLAGNFFSVDLAQSRHAFETVPWVRRAVVRRIWPDRLRVRLEEQHPAALWEGTADADDADKLVNEQGEVFEANLGEVEGDGLPTFAGPDGSAAQMLALYRRLQPVLARAGMTISRLTLSGRGSWLAELDSGAEVEIGRGSDDELVARSARFVRTLGQVTARYHAPLAYADLRHPDGYAVRLRGVVITPAAPAAARTH
ncbi:MAG: cell division protein FtsQ/DivIB [Burkholderiales bacterium]|nr:cell division protein FtsQ/DivIB [Burkholderiales bacterium]MDE1927387.1 cell division protein FtsQ/DivIB [Burkholderiales bacterium]MDE2157832.1 cell division protein FtsQ/DivIB [Burkholderiales bacterium]MDE2504652.1 cell division protein FtsQ/DivIB [Burkholderiales bacterium]